MAGSQAHTVAQASERCLEADMRDFDDRNIQRYCLLAVTMSMFERYRKTIMYGKSNTGQGVRE